MGVAAKTCTFNKKHYRSRGKNRHHLLFPGPLWNNIGKNALQARNASVIIIDEHLHVELHRQLNKTMSRKVTREMLPDRRTIMHIRRRCKKNSSTVRQMDAIEKTKWFVEGLNPSIERNQWTIMMLNMQLKFLEEHAEEL